jgi:hypothetical protein
MKENKMTYTNKDISEAFKEAKEHLMLTGFICHSIEVTSGYCSQLTNECKHIISDRIAGYYTLEGWLFDQGINVDLLESVGLSEMLAYRHR